LRCELALVLRYELASLEGSLEGSLETTVGRKVWVREGGDPRPVSRRRP
jgi:hypothetical protein